MTPYDIVNECMEALEEREADHVGADYDETKRSLSSRNRSQLNYKSQVSLLNYTTPSSQVKSSGSLYSTHTKQYIFAVVNAAERCGLGCS